MRSLLPLLLGLSVSSLVVGCPGDDGTSAGTSASTTSPTSSSTSDSSASSTSSTDGSSSTTATATSNSTTAGECSPDQTPCGGDCCDPNEICVDGACSAITTMPPTTDPSTGGTESSTGTGSSTGGTGTSTGGTDTSSGTTGGDPACALMYDTGPCDGAFVRFWFNPQTMKCEEFSWGGCGGVVPFEDLQSCQSACE